MIGLVLVSHSASLAQGLRDIASQMSRGKVTIIPAGGVDEETLGTNAERIHQALETALAADGVLVLFDLGSALMSAQMAIDMLSPDQQPRVKLSNAPLVEGTIVAAVEASLGRSLEEVNAAAEAAKDMQKIV